MNIVNIKRLLCVCQSYLVCFRWSSHFQFATDCHLYASGLTIYQYEQKEITFQRYFWLYRSLWNVLLEQEHFNVTSQRVVLKHYLKINILNRKLLWELTILIKCNKFDSLISRLFYQYPAVMNEWWGQKQSWEQEPEHSWCKLSRNATCVSWTGGLGALRCMVA